MTHAHLIISGRVHGVSFRYRAQAHAVRLGVRGWVRNLKDGTVEMEVEADSVHLDQFIDWCRRGPLFASVDEVTVTHGPVCGFESFEIVR